MGWVMMSERDLNHIEVLAQVDDGRQSSAMLSSPRKPSKTILIFSSEEYCLRVARLNSLTSFSPGLLRIPLVGLMSNSSVVTMSQKHPLIKFTLFGPVSADVRQWKPALSYPTLLTAGPGLFQNVDIVAGDRFGKFPVTFVKPETNFDAVGCSNERVFFNSMRFFQLTFLEFVSNLLKKA